MTVYIENEYEGMIPEHHREIAEKVIAETLRREGCPYECEVNLLLTDDDAIEALNEEFRSIDSSTDVLSFPMIGFETPADFSGFDKRPDLFDPENGELLLGDIVLSMDHVIRQAEEYGHGIVREYAFLIAHSMLHLLGYDHMEDGERIRMEEKQDEILNTAGYTR